MVVVIAPSGQNLSPLFPAGVPAQEIRVGEPDQTMEQAIFRLANEQDAPDRIIITKTKTPDFDPKMLRERCRYHFPTTDILLLDDKGQTDGDCEAPAEGPTFADFYLETPVAPRALPEHESVQAILSRPRTKGSVLLRGQWSESRYGQSGDP